MADLGKTIILFGIVLVFVGSLLLIFPKISLPGRLPGDILVKKDGFTFYFPLATSILISLFLTVLINIFFRR